MTNYSQARCQEEITSIHELWTFCRQLWTYCGQIVDVLQCALIADYFKPLPVQTYCRLLDWTGSFTGEDAQKGCGDIGMTLRSSKTVVQNVHSEGPQYLLV